MVLSRNDSSLSEKQFGPWGAGRQGDIHALTGRKVRGTEGAGSDLKGKTRRPGRKGLREQHCEAVWGWRHLLHENKGGWVALVRTRLQDRGAGQQKRAVFRLRGPSASYSSVSSADLSAAEEGSDK